MAVVIRFARHGSKKRPFYRIVAADKKYSRDGRYLEIVGTYNPKTKEANLKEDRIQHWLDQGAIPSETAGRLIKKSGQAA